MKYWSFKYSEYEYGLWSVLYQTILEYISVLDIRKVYIETIRNDTVSTIDYITKIYASFKTEALSVFDYIKAMTYVRINERIAIIDSAKKLLNGVLSWIWEKVSKIVGIWVKSSKDSTDDWKRNHNP